MTTNNNENKEIIIVVVVRSQFFFKNEYNRITYENKETIGTKQKKYGQFNVIKATFEHQT